MSDNYETGYVGSPKGSFLDNNKVDDNFHPNVSPRVLNISVTFLLHTVEVQVTVSGIINGVVRDNLVMT